MLWENLVSSVGMMGGGRGGLVTAVMNHLAPPLPPTTQSAPSSKRSEPVEQTEGLYNFAPLAVVTSSNPTARPANVLVDSNQLFQRTKVIAHFFSPFPSECQLRYTFPIHCLCFIQIANKYIPVVVKIWCSLHLAIQKAKKS